MVSPFKKPFKEVEASQEKLVPILIFGLFIFLFLFFFKPFGLAQLKPVQLIFVTLGFGLVTTFMLFITEYLMISTPASYGWYVRVGLMK